MDTNSIIMMLQDKLPKNPSEQMALRDKLDKLSASKRDELMRNLALLDLKNPTLVFWVGSFLFGEFGVGRFMIGNKVLGAIRLALALFFYLFLMIYTESESGIAAFLAVVLLLAVRGWWIADLFLTGKKLRQQNLDKVLQAIG